MKNLLAHIRQLYQPPASEYIIERNFDTLIGQLDGASENKTEIKAPDIRQPAWISGMTITHFFPNEFQADYTSHFIGRKGFPPSHLYGNFEKLSETAISLKLRQVPSFATTWLFLPLLVSGTVYSSTRTTITSPATFAAPLILLLAAISVIYINRRIFYLLEKICIAYIKSGQELII